MPNCLVSASKLDKHTRTCCTAEWPFCPFALLSPGFKPVFHFSREMDKIEYATFRYDTIEVENWLNGARMCKTVEICMELFFPTINH